MSFCLDYFINIVDDVTYIFGVVFIINVVLEDFWVF